MKSGKLDWLHAKPQVACVIATLSSFLTFGLVYGIQSGQKAQAPMYPFFILTVMLNALAGGLYSGLVSVSTSALLIYGCLLPSYALALGRWRALLTFIAFVVIGAAMSNIIAALGRRGDALQHQLLITETITSTAADGLFMLDDRGQVKFMNPAAEAMFGFKAEELVGKILHEAVHNRHPDGSPYPISECPLHQIYGTGTTLHNHEDVFFHKDGRPVPVACSHALLFQNNRLVASVLVIRDETERKRAERTLIHTEQLAAAGRLAATIAHEVNNPLAGALNAVYVARTTPELTDSMLITAEEELGRASRIVRQTLGFYREIGKKQPVALVKIIDEVLGIYADRARKRDIKIQRKNTCGPCADGCEGCFLRNSGELRQIGCNLITNGIDALSDHGTLHVRLARMTRLNGSGQELRLTIADNGQGIRTDNLKRIFEPFFTTKGGNGTGLGLWVTQELVRKHGGRIRVRSRVSKGTVLCLYFPLESHRWLK